jgi:glycosyltransferase involved in cell wall biosynthesis
MPNADVSVIVPTRNRPAALGACLASLSAQDLPGRAFEIIVVNDGGVAVDAAVAQASRSTDAPVRLLVQPHAGQGAARNAGLAAASGAVVAFIDDDCAADPGWLASLAGRLARGPRALVGGRTVNALVDNPFSTASQLLLAYLYDYFERAATEAHFFAACNLAAPARLLRELGGFDTTNPEAVCEDRELCDRARQQGVTLVSAPEAVVHHRHAMGLAGFCRQHLHYGRGASHLRRLRGRRGLAPMPLEPLRFYVDLVRYPFQHYPAARAARLSSLMALTQVAHAVGYAREEVRATLARPPRP